MLFPLPHNFVKFSYTFSLFHLFPPSLPNCPVLTSLCSRRNPSGSEGRVVTTAQARVHTGPAAAEPSIGRGSRRGWSGFPQDISTSCPVRNQGQRDCEGRGVRGEDLHREKMSTSASTSKKTGPSGKGQNCSLVTRKRGELTQCLKSIHREMK